MSESTIFINVIPHTTVAWLLQYSGSRVEHTNTFLSVIDLQLAKKSEFHFGLGVF